MYRCEARTVSHFIRHLAVNYVSRGYFFYVKGEVPPGKDPAKTDAKIIEHYGIDISKWSRCRRRRAGESGIQYLRCGRQFVILATHGKHRFFEDEAQVIRDIRRLPFRCGGYSVGYRDRLGRGHVSVRIEKDRFEELKSYFLSRARKASVEELVAELLSFSFPPFAPVRRQILSLGRAINVARKLAGLETVPLTVFVEYCSRSRSQSARLLISKPSHPHSSAQSLDVSPVGSDSAISRINSSVSFPPTERAQPRESQRSG